MPALPTGTVTFLYTDVEGSTRLLQAIEERYAAVVAQQRRNVIDNVLSHRGVIVDAVGDSVFAAFARAKDAAAAAAAAQRAITAYPWAPGDRVRVRMGIHTGEPSLVESGYVGIDVHRAARICAAAHGGQILLSQTTRELIANDLPAAASLRDLGKHRLKDLARPLHLYQLTVPDLPSDFPLLRTLSVLPNNLPSLLTSFIGREREMAEIKDRLSRNRLVTLVGVGGGGKTRLALQVAAEIFEVYPDGVWLVELTTLSDPALISHTMSSLLGIREEPGRPILQTLLDYLKTKRLLLVMDNCEHLLRETAGLAHTLLRACPSIQILATSREPLHVKGEVSYRVPSLNLPSNLDLSPQDLLTCEAVQLFVDRAVRALPSFSIHGENAHTVATICNRLDGIPLALELAASQVRALPLAQIAGRLDDRFTLLTGHGRGDVPQHQTLQAAMDWSYDLLSSQEQVALRRLSVFVGGLTLDAAERICSDDRVRRTEMVNHMVQLVDKSLVQYRPEEGRYDLLETVRQYAWSKLQEAEASDALQERHLGFFLDLAQAAGENLRTADAGRWLDRIEVDHDNFRVALGWSLSSGNVTSAAQIGRALWWFWLVRGHWSEGWDWLERVLKSVGQAPIRGSLLNGAAMLAYYQRLFERAEALANESLSFCRSLHDHTGTAFALCLLAEIERGRRDYDRVVDLGEQSVALFDKVDDIWGRAYARLVLGATIVDDKRAQALRLYEEGLRLFRIVGDPWGILLALARLGRIAARSDFARAESLYTECRTLSEQLRDKWGIANALAHLGFVKRIRGSYDDARSLLEQSLTLFERLGDKNMSTYPLEELALLALYAGDNERASRLLDKAVAMSRESEGDKLGLAVCLHRLAVVRHVEGLRTEARTLLEESLSLYRDLHEKLGFASCLSDLGRLCVIEGVPEYAIQLQKQSLRICQEFSAVHGIAQSVERLGVIAGALRRHRRAARLLGAAATIREVLGVPLSPVERSDHDHTVESARTALGEPSFDTAWSEGRQMTLDEAVDVALKASA